MSGRTSSAWLFQLVGSAVAHPISPDLLARALSGSLAPHSRFRQCVNRYSAAPQTELTHAGEHTCTLTNTSSA